jgi:general secretion pathway protein J
MTLIEILVAVALLGLLSAGIVASLDVSSRAWQATRNRLTLDRRIATANSILHSQISGIAPILAEIPPQRRIGLANFVFFQGEPDAMRFVSSYSVTAGRRAGLQIVELKIVDSQRGRRVLLNQTPYQGPLSAGLLVEAYVRDASFPRGRIVFRPIEPRATSLIILDELQDCNFAYLKEPWSISETSVWLPLWGEPYELPGAVAIRLTPRGEQARLLPVSIVAAVPAQGALP